MKLDFKGIITKEALEKDINNLDEIMNENDYAIVVENGVGRYVIFDIDYVNDKLELKEELSLIKNYRRSPYTLVEAMIKTLEQLPEKKTSAIMLSSLVLDFYGKKARPVTVRTRAEENANGKGDTNYFTIEPGNIIGLSNNSSFELYMYNKFKRAMDLELTKMFIKEPSYELNSIHNRIHLILQSLAFNKYPKKIKDDDINNIILSLNKYRIKDNHLILNK